jgi:DNA-directed RNA polymerase specialized sigma24 family protein
MSRPRPVKEIDRRRIDELLSTFVGGGWRGGTLRAILADRFPDRPPEEIEDAVQGACTAFLEEGEGITEERAVYSWIRTAAYHALLHELRRHRHLVAVDPGEGPVGGAIDGGPGPAEELIALEDEGDLDVLVREVTSSLSGTRREVLALWAAGHRRSEIAAELGIGERAVKRALEEIMGEARSTLARRAGGGCEEGEPLVLRFACGLAPAQEAIRAKAHLEGCGRCSSFAESLEAWRDKAGAILPLPAAEVASPGLLGRAAARVGDAVGSARRHLFGGGAQVKGRAAVAGVGTTGDPTPLAGVRPGAVAAVLASCLAVGGGATYCAQQGVDPLGAAKNLIAGIEEPAEEPPEGGPQAKAPVTPAYEPVPEEAQSYQPEEEAPPASEPTPTASQPGQHEEAKTAKEPEAEPEPEEVTPPPEQSFEPASPDYPATESESTSSGSTTTESSTPAQPKAVAAGEAPQFGGP